MPKQKEVLDQFVDRLLQEKKLADSDPEVMAQLHEDLASRVESHINAAILSQMPPEHLEEFTNVLDVGDGDKIWEFCKKHVSDVDSVVAQALLDFRNNYLGV